MTIVRSVDSQWQWVCVCVCIDNRYSMHTYTYTYSLFSLEGPNTTLTKLNSRSVLLFDNSQTVCFHFCETGYAIPGLSQSSKYFQEPQEP